MSELYTVPAFTYTERAPLLGAQGVALDFPDDVFLVAIGDVHGQAEAFHRALRGASTFAAPGKRRVLVLTGDLIDRGPKSLLCLLIASAATQRYGFDEVVYLPGNHELLMLDALDEMEGQRPDRAGSTWLCNGGLAFLSEVLGETWVQDKSPYEDIAARFTDALPPINALPYRDALRAAPSHARFGDVLLVHAGIHPGHPLDVALAQPQSTHISRETDAHGLSQHHAHWAWVRDPFLLHPDGHTDAAGRPILVVHGHTVVQGASPLWLLDANGVLGPKLDQARTRGRICIDAGAANGALVAGMAITSEGYRLFASPCGG